MYIAHVVFTEQPSLTDSLPTPNTVAITCTTKSTPIAEITWFLVQNSITTQLMNSSRALITTEQIEQKMRSTLQLAPIEDLSITGLYCKGDNGFLQSDSEILETSRSKNDKSCLQHDH